MQRQGLYYRVCDPLWIDCCDAGYSKIFGGRWNAPESFPVLYLNRDIDTARENARRTYEGEAFGLLDLNPTARPHLQVVSLARCTPIDAFTPEGIHALGLPSTYPHSVGHKRCQKIGERLHREGASGIACRSTANPNGEELALMDLHLATKKQRIAFDEWFLQNDDALAKFPPSPPRKERL
ncbi:MAG: RES family NAD+ phosphorylase [Vulcanimicrobiaceae bacterium]